MKTSFLSIKGSLITSLALLVVTSLFSACIPTLTTTPDPLVPTIAALQTEQAGLQSLLAEIDAPTVVVPSTPTEQPSATPTPLPSDTPAPGFLGLPQALYFLAPDGKGLEQVWRLESDGSNRTQLTSETRSLQEFDISSRGDLAYVVWNTPQGAPRLIVQTADGAPPQAIAELNANYEIIKNVRWLPDGDALVFHRSVVVGEPPKEGTPITASELVLYKLSDASVKVLLRTGPDPIDPVVGTMYTNESLEYDAMNNWQVIYQVTTISPDGRFLLLNDSGGPFWAVYDLRTNSVYHYKIRSVSADINPNGLFVCLAGVTNEPDYLGKQALLCADVVANAVNTYLNTPPWQPFGTDYWPADNALVFLQISGQGNSSLLQIYGLTLDGTEPLLLRQENFTFSDAQTGPGQVLYSPQENQANGMVIVAGQTPAMETPGLVFVPLDVTKPIQSANIGPARQPRWGPSVLP